MNWFKKHDDPTPDDIYGVCGCAIFGLVAFIFVAVLIIKYLIFKV